MKTKNIITLGLLTMVVILTAGFNSSKSSPPPPPIPDYTMIDIPNPPSCYALKVVGYGYQYYPAGDWQYSQYTVYNPNSTSIWNLSGKYNANNYFIVEVWVQLTSQSQMLPAGYITKDDYGVTLTTYPDNPYVFLSKMEFSYGCLIAPDEED